MASTSDYIKEIQKYAPYFDPSQGNVMGELNRRATEGASVDQVVNDALGPGGYAENQLSAQNYLKPQYDAQLAGLDTQQKQAQSTADYQTGLATNASNRLMDAVGRTYAQRQANDPLARQGIVSGAAQNYQTDEQARNYANINTDLQTQLHDIAGQLGAVTGGIAGQRSALGQQQAQGVTALMTNARSAVNVANNTPYGTPTDVNGTTVFGRNQNTGFLNLLQNPSFSTLLYGAANNPGLHNVLNGVLAPYGINVTNDLVGGAVPAASSPAAASSQAAVSSPKPIAASTTSTAGNQFAGDVQAAVQSGRYTANGQAGKTSREQLIKDIASHYAIAGADPRYQQIVDAVYQNFKG